MQKKKRSNRLRRILNEAGDDRSMRASFKANAELMQKLAEMGSTETRSSFKAEKPLARKNAPG